MFEIFFGKPMLREVFQKYIFSLMQDITPINRNLLT